jgi:type I restriction enzyme S subunit
MNTKWWSYQMNASGSGSVRSRIYYDDLASLHVNLPTVQEQELICEVLDAAQRLTELSTIETELLMTQKRGLMQKLLTGEIRVTVEQHHLKEASVG